MSIINEHSRHVLGLACLGLALLAPAAGYCAELDVGGWAGFAYMDDDRPGSIPTFDAHPWYMYVAARPVPGWKFFGELEAEHVFQFSAGKTGAGTLYLDRLYIERNFCTAHNLRLGKTYLPFGYWYDLHWHFLTETLSRPLTFDNAYVPRHNVGIQYSGRGYAGDTRIQYFAWVGNGPDVFGTDARTVDAFGRGASVFLEHDPGGDGSRTLGLVAAWHAQSVAGQPAPDEQSSLAVGCEVAYDALRLRAEHYRHDGSVRGRLGTWYVNASWFLDERVALNLRLEDGANLRGAVDDLNAGSRIVSGGIVYRPEAQVLLKAEYRVTRFDDPSTADYANWNGYLALKY